MRLDLMNGVERKLTLAACLCSGVFLWSQNALAHESLLSEDSKMIVTAKEVFPEGLDRLKMNDGRQVRKGTIRAFLNNIDAYNQVWNVPDSAEKRRKLETLEQKIREAIIDLKSLGFFDAFPIRMWLNSSLPPAQMLLLKEAFSLIPNVFTPEDRYRFQKINEDQREVLNHATPLTPTDVLKDGVDFAPEKNGRIVRKGTIKSMFENIREINRWFRHEKTEEFQKKMDHIRPDLIELVKDLESIDFFKTLTPEFLLSDPANRGLMEMGLIYKSLFLKEDGKI